MVLCTGLPFLVVVCASKPRSRPQPGKRNWGRLFGLEGKEKVGYAEDEYADVERRVILGGGCPVFARGVRRSCAPWLDRAQSRFLAPVVESRKKPPDPEWPASYRSREASCCARIS